jgi:hypothetical protein
MYFEQIFNLIYGAAIIYALLVALYFYIKGQRQRRRSVTLDYIKRWNQEYALLEPKSFSSRLNVYSKRAESSIIRSIAAGHISEDSRDLIATWNFYEELAIAIFFHEADEEMAKEFFSTPY